MSKWNGIFNGTYSTSRYANYSLEDDILNAGIGIFAVERSDGGLNKYKDDRIDVWGKGDGKGNYPHYYYNGKDDYDKAPDDRHK